MLFLIVMIPFLRYDMELYRTYGTLGEEDNDVTWVAPTPVLFRLYKAWGKFVTIQVY